MLKRHFNLLFQQSLYILCTLPVTKPFSSATPLNKKEPKPKSRRTYQHTYKINQNPRYPAITAYSRSINATHSTCVVIAR